MVIQEGMATVFKEKNYIMGIVNWIIEFQIWLVQSLMSRQPSMLCE